MKKLNKYKVFGANAYLYLLLVALYLPIIVIIVFSFTENKVLGTWTGFSFGLYRNLFSGAGGTALTKALFNTLVIALAASSIATLLGTMAAFGIFHLRQRMKKIVLSLNQVPMINPDIITGISLFLLFVALGVSRGMATIVIAHVVFCTPYVVLSVMPRLQKMNPNIYEAAIDLGATPTQAFYKVIMPELWPGIVSGFILSITLSIDDFGVTLFTKGSVGIDTLSTYIYADAKRGGLTPELRPLFTLIFVIILILLIIINLHSKKQNEET